MSSYNPNVQSHTEDAQGFPRIRVDDINANDLLREVIMQLKLVSLKLDCLQSNDDELDVNELDTLDLQ